MYNSNIHTKIDDLNTLKTVFNLVVYLMYKCILVSYLFNLKFGVRWHIFNNKNINFIEMLNCYYEM